MLGTLGIGVADISNKPVCGRRIDLELFKAADVMRSPVLTLMSRQSLHLLAQILLDTPHSGFPVIETNQETGDEVAYGLITRSLSIIIIIIILIIIIIIILTIRS